MILSLIYPRVLFPMLFPVSYLTYWIISVLRLKDKRNAFYINTLAIFLLLILPTSCLWIDIYNVLLVFPFILLIFLLVELTMLAVSIVFCYGFKFLSSYGVLHYRFQISLIEEEYREVHYSFCCCPFVNRIPKNIPDSISHKIRHAPFQRLYNRPILDIFKDMEISTYNFGEINGQLVTQDGINSYNLYYSLYSY